MTRLLLVRHAQSQNNLSDELIYEQYRHDRLRARLEAGRARRPDPELSDIGRMQAEQLAEALVPALTEKAGRTLLISSPMRRALQTAMPIAVGAGFERERFFCHTELFELGSGYYGDHALPSSRVAQLEADYPLTCHAVPNDDLYVGTRGESEERGRARVDRVIAWFEATLAREQYDLLIVVAHGHLLTRWLRRWIGVPWGSGLAFVHANASLTMLHWDACDGLLLEFTNETAHLEPEICTGGHSSGWWSYSSPDLLIEPFFGREDLDPLTSEELAAFRGLLGRPMLDPSEESEFEQHSTFVTARVEDELVGYAEYDPDLGRLRDLVVSPSHRRARIGRRLVAEIELLARMREHEQLEAHAQVHMVRYFRALGFVETGPAETGSDTSERRLVKPLPPLVRR
jgi:2,3-bisphosphoglycerate-dependent phosphoglycerate mutase